MIRRALVIAALVVLGAGTLGPLGAAAADPWTVLGSDRVAASFTSGTSGADVTLALENRTSIADEAGLGPDAKFILEALGLAGDYSQTASWKLGSGPAIACLAGANLGCATNPDGAGAVLIPGTVRAALVAHAPAGPGRTDLAVGPNAGSVMFDIALVAVGIVLDTAGVPGASADAVATLALQLRPEAAFVEAALERGDLRTAGSDLLALIERAWTTIREKVVGIGVGLALDLVPGALEVKFAIAAAKAIPPLANLRSALIHHASGTVSVAFAGDIATATAPPASLQAATPNPDNISEFTVDGSHPRWTETGFLVHAGDQLHFRATGEVFWDPAVPEPNVGPGGASWTPSGVSNPAQFPLPEAPIASLIGKIGDWVFPIGPDRVITVPSTGLLSLGMNERWVDGAWDDNSGSWQVRVQIERS